MPAGFQLTELAIQRFRLFKAISVSGFRRINIIGGSNGVGKSSLLEAGFHLADRLNPGTLFRPFEWRGIPIAPGDQDIALREIFFDQNTDGSIEIYAKTSLGEYSVAYSFGPVPSDTPLVATVSRADVTKSPYDSYTSPFGRGGFSIRGTHNNKEDLTCNVQFAGEGFAVQMRRQPPPAMPRCMILNAVTRRIPNDIAERFSKCVRSNRTHLLYQFIHLVHPQINELHLLQTGGQSVIYADTGENKLVPIPFLGEGASTLLNLALALVDVEGGILFLDEMDSVVHHSLLVDMWRLIYEMSEKMSVQVFSTTHSEESLEACVAAADSMNNLKHLSYHRLRRSKSGEVGAVHYTGTKLRSSLGESWEVR